MSTKTQHRQRDRLKAYVAFETSTMAMIFRCGRILRFVGWRCLTRIGIEIHSEKQGLKDEHEQQNSKLTGQIAHC